MFAQGKDVDLYQGQHRPLALIDSCAYTFKECLGGAVVESLTQDRDVASFSLTGGTAFF